MKFPLFKRAETVSRADYDDAIYRYQVALGNKQSLINSLVVQRDAALAEVSQLRAEHNRRIAPLMAANAARKEAAAAKRKAGA